MVEIGRCQLNVTRKRYHQGSAAREQSVNRQSTNCVANASVGEVRDLLKSKQCPESRVSWGMNESHGSPRL